MKILGLSFDYHDAAAALLIDGKVVAAAQEERFSRRKHDSSLPKLAAAFCLEQAGIASSDLDAVVFYERTMLKFDRIVTSVLDCYPQSRSYYDQVMQMWFQHGKFDVRERIAAALSVPLDRIRAVDHHQSHAAASFFSSGFDRSTIISMDALGEYETATVSIGEGTRIEQILSIQFPQSIGLFYSAFTGFLGFEVNSGEYKVMGMAGFGEPVYYDKIRALIELQPDGGFAIDQKLFDFYTPLQQLYRPEFLEIFGEAREPEGEFVLDELPDGSNREIVSRSRHYANVAASVQKCTEDVIFHLVESAVAKTGVTDVCLAGGVALNSLANGKLQRRGKCRLFIQPAAGDDGGALGAALFHYHHNLGARRCGPFVSPYLGREYPRSEIEAAIAKARLTGRTTEFPDDESLCAHVAEKLMSGSVVGWMQGRFEWGPRALGNRSILASPLLPEMKEIVNTKIKFREPFRPFAPSVLSERGAEFFNIPTDLDPSDPEYFMLAVADVREDKKAIIPAVTHVDGTARLHLVSSEINPLYYQLIQAFGGLTGVPVVMNTSFNLRGEPIVSSPADAIKTFSWSHMDIVVIGRFVVSKK